jgi:two-component system, cell cycle sensor histidine kinase and response regulator CckA
MRSRQVSTRVRTVVQDDTMSGRHQTPRDARMLTALLEHSSDTTVLFDGTGAIVYVSPSTTRMLGYSIDELVGTNVFERVHGDDLPKMRATLARGLQEPGTAIALACRYRHRDGSWRDLEGVGVNRLDDPAVRGIIVSYRDVTERRLTQAAIQSGEDQYRYLVTHASDIIYTCDTQGRFTFCNPTAVRLMKYAEEELLGRHFLTLIRQDCRDAAERFYARQLAERIPTTYFEFPAVAKDGTEVWFGQNVQLVISDDHIVGVQAIARDITERLALEERLRQAQKMEAIGRLAGGIAHDFNNVLTAILGSSDLLSLQLDPNDPRWAEADAIRRAAERGAALTRRLLAFSRPHGAPVEVLELSELVRDMDPMLRRLGLERIQTRIVAPQGPVHVESDRGQIEQVVMNLVLNARDAMLLGGTITIDIGMADLDQTASSRLGLAPDRYARLSVTDAGDGMDAVTKAHLFEPFFTTKDPGKGTGLGLSIVYTIVKGHGGAIAVVSEPGQGATFHIYLPLARRSQ